MEVITILYKCLVFMYPLKYSLNENETSKMSVPSSISTLTFNHQGVPNALTI